MSIAMLVARFAVYIVKVKDTLPPLPAEAWWWEGRVDESRKLSPLRKSFLPGRVREGLKEESHDSWVKGKRREKMTEQWKEWREKRIL